VKSIFFVIAFIGLVLSLLLCYLKQVESLHKKDFAKI